MFPNLAPPGPDHQVAANGVLIVRTPTGIGVAFPQPQPRRPLLVEVDYEGRRLKEEWLDSCGPPWRDFYHDIDMTRVVVRVKDQGVVLAELSLPGEEYPLPYMVPRAEQAHETESYCSVPPCLTITTPGGDVWTLGWKAAPRELCPWGEFAFEVLRNGRTTHEYASRIERRNGKLRILTSRGWLVWGRHGHEFL